MTGPVPSHPPTIQENKKKSKMVKWKMRERVRGADITEMGRREGGGR